MSDSVWPHRRQPTRLPRPWDSPGKNTRVACHCLLQCMKVKSESDVGRLCPTLSDPMDCSLPGSSVHGIFPSKSTGVGCHCLLRRTWTGHLNSMSLNLSVKWDFIPSFNKYLLQFYSALFCTNSFMIFRSPFSDSFLSVLMELQCLALKLQFLKTAWEGSLKKTAKKSFLS